MALINVTIIKRDKTFEDQMEDFDWAALNNGDRVYTVVIRDTFTVVQKEVTTTKAADGSITTRRVLYI